MVMRLVSGPFASSIADPPLCLDRQDSVVDGDLDVGCSRLARVVIE
jgi:hypothetical protein